MLYVVIATYGRLHGIIACPLIIGGKHGNDPLYDDGVCDT